MRARILVLGASLVALMAMAATASATGGPDFDDVFQKRACVQAGPVDNWHCFNGGFGQGKASGVLVFAADEPNDFLGIETLLFAPVDAEPFASGVPCPKDHGGEWEWVGFAWACHHWQGAPE